MSKSGGRPCAGPTMTGEQPGQEGFGTGTQVRVARLMTAHPGLVLALLDLGLDKKLQGFQERHPDWWKHDFLLSAPACRRDDAYWPEAKRPALDERYHSDFSRQDRFHDFDHRDRGRYPDHSVDRSAR